MIYIGIDPGVNTGLAIWDSQGKAFISIETLSLIQAMRKVQKFEATVIFEDARLRTWFGKSGREKLQGAGSIKRDCQIWEEFLTELKVKFHMVAPKNNKTKLNAKTFQALTKWEKPTNQHGRDAAMLVVGK